MKNCNLRIEKINKKEYYVHDEEFKIKHNETFFNLKIIPDVGILERYIGLLNDLSKLFDYKPIMLENNPNNSGFINLECSKNFEKIILNDVDKNQLISINKNIEKHNLSNIIIDNNDNIERKNKIDIIKINKSNIENKIIEIIKKDLPIILCLNENKELKKIYKKKYILENSDYHLYIPNNKYDIFYNEFYYYIDEENKILKYDNLLHLTMIVKNAGNTFEEVLKENLKYIDQWTILDTGSTDGTQEVIKRVLKDKKGKLYEEPFINFRESRNRCLELAPNNCKFKIMLDDTYIIKGDLRNFLKTIRGDQFSDSFSLNVQSYDLEYSSNRIIKSDFNLKYISKIHEIIQKENNVNVMIPKYVSYIYDETSDYMQDRTDNRKELDLKLLYEMVEEEPNEPRHLYYLAQTYNCIKNYEKAAEYYKKRYEFHEEGFLQEKLDACFELARKYNFELNYPWDICKLYYIKAYELDTKRPDALFYLGLHYYLNNDYKEAFPYMKKAFEIGFPFHAQYSLKPTLSYKFLPQILSRMCYSLKEYKLGEEACQLFLSHNDNKTEYFDEVISWYSIYKNLNKIMNLENKNNNKNSKPIFCYLADGGYTNWSGSSILKNGVGGSESYIIEMAKYIKKHSDFDVYVFCKTDKYEKYEDVNYLHITTFPSFIKNNNIHSCVISRFSEYLPMTYYGNIQNIYFLLHDLGPIGCVLPLDQKLKNIICLTNWHKKYFSKNFPSCEHLTTVYPNGIDMKKFDLKIKPKKIPFKFIYSSFANRGLLNILRMWDKILYNFPSATLHIYCDIYHKWVLDNYPNEAKEIQQIIESGKYKFSVFNHGWVDKETLAQSWLTSQFWLYPCVFQETFCITALEAAVTKTLAITNDLGALVDTVGDRGIMIKGDATTIEWQDKMIIELKEITQNENKMNELLEKNYQWSKYHNWENLAISFIDKFLGKEHLVLH